MYRKDIISNIQLGNNQTIYREDMYQIYKAIIEELYQPKRSKYDINYKCIYIDTQKDKDIILDAIKAVKDINPKKKKLHKLKQEDLIEMLIAILPGTQLIIVYNYLEDMTNKREQLFRKLMRHKVLFIAGFQKMPKENRMPFFKKHYFVNKAEYELLKGENKIDITYFFYMFITIFMVLIFLRIVSLGTIGDIAASALWFGLLVFRTFSYIGGKV